MLEVRAMHALAHSVSIAGRARAVGQVHRCLPTAPIQAIAASVRPFGHLHCARLAARAH